MVGTGTEVLAGDRGDPLRSAVRHDGVDQAIGAAIGQVLLGEAVAQEVAG